MNVWARLAGKTSAQYSRNSARKAVSVPEARSSVGVRVGMVFMRSPNGISGGAAVGGAMETLVLSGLVQRHAQRYGRRAAAALDQNLARGALLGGSSTDALV